MLQPSIQNPDSQARPLGRPRHALHRCPRPRLGLHSLALRPADRPLLLPLTALVGRAGALGSTAHRTRASTTLPIRAAKHQSRFESSLGVIRSHSSMTNDHFSILNFQFTSMNRWPSPLMQPQQNLTCLQRLLVFKDSSHVRRAPGRQAATGRRRGQLQYPAAIARREARHAHPRSNGAARRRWQVRSLATWCSRPLGSNTRTSANCRV